MISPLDRAGLASHAPCGQACPIDQNVKEYVALVGEGRFVEALEVIRRSNPFPAICGRVCSHPCEMECESGGREGPVPIRWIKRFVADLDLDRGAPAAARVAAPRGTRIAVVGAGPAGLAAARDLASLGHGVTVVEAMTSAGGMMRWGIPGFRLPRGLVEAECGAVLSICDEVRMGVVLGRDTSVEDLFREGFSAVLVSVGAGRQAEIGLDGEPGTPGFADTIGFLAREGDETARGRRVVVVGLTRQGFDVARLAARGGARSVTIIGMASREAIPVDRAVVEEAEADGVRILHGTRPVEALVRDGRLSGLAIEPGVLPAAAGAAASRAKARKLPCDLVFPAVDRYVSDVAMRGMGGVEATPWKGISADPCTGATALPGVFAAGDAVTGPKTVVEAIAAGHRVAAAIHRRLTGEDWKHRGRPAPAGPGPEAFEVRSAGGEAPRGTGRSSPGGGRPLEGPEDAMRQARRCLRCGLCLDCETCHPDCPTRVAMLPRGGDSSPAWGDPMVKIDSSVLHEVLAGCAGGAWGMAGRLPVVPVPEVDRDACLGCGSCVDACPYRVVRLDLAPDGLGVARIDEGACRACGCCVAACPVAAIDQPYWSRAGLLRSVARPGEALRLACVWSGDPGSGGAVVPLPCAGRADVATMVGALASGAGPMTVVDCGTGSCRYRDGAARGEGAAHRFGVLLGRLGISGTLRGPVARSDGSRSASARGPFGSPMTDIERILGDPGVVPPAPSIAVPATGGPSDVVLWPGCSQFLDALSGCDLDVPPMERLGAVAALLGRAGVAFTVASGARTCGAALAHAGDAEGFARLASLNLGALAGTGASTVVTACPAARDMIGRQARACGSTPGFRVLHWAELLSGMGWTPEPATCREVEESFAIASSGSASIDEACAWLLSAAGLGVVAVGIKMDGSGRAGTAGALAAARDAGASVLVTVSQGCGLEASYATRRGSWDAFGIRVRDLAVILAGGSR